VTSLLDGRRPEEPAAPPPVEDEDRPRTIKAALPPSDHVFRNVARSIGIFVLLLTGSIGLFLGYQSIPTFKRYGLGFFTESQWQPELDKVGISAVLLGTVIVAIIALLVGFPLAFLTALYISEYAPPRFKGTAIAAIDLMAAVPSIIYGLFGFAFVEPHAQDIARWLHQNLGFIPIFKVDTNPNAASWSPAAYFGSAFIGGVCVSLMIIPLACSIMQGVFSLAPIGEREAAYALGSTRWGMIRTVVLPFGRGGIIGGTMLGLGRALGETVAVMLVISQTFEIKFKILSSGTNTTSALIASRFSEATSAQLAALLTAGFVLFLLTLGVNTVAAVFVSRSRSGSGVEI
jgi:phosphate transport system permease protein